MTAKAFSGRSFSRRSRLDGRLVAGVHQELESPDSLERHDPSPAQALGRPGQGPVPFRKDAPEPVPERELRPAGGTGVGLGVKSPVEGIGILAPAFRAHREGAHRGVRAVVGQRPDDAEARAAMGAVGEGIAVAPVGRIEDFPPAFRARGEIGDHEGAGVAVRLAGADLESAGGPAGVAERNHGLPDQRVGRLIRLEPEQELVEVRLRPLDVDHDAVRRVVDASRQAELAGEPVDEGPETDSLDGPAHDHPGAELGRTLSGGGSFGKRPVHARWRGLLTSWGGRAVAVIGRGAVRREPGRPPRGTRVSRPAAPATPRPGRP